MMQGLARALLESDFAQGQKPWGSDPSPSDRPMTQAHSQRMGLQDNPIRVQLGFHTRPLRDGGGKPSWGRTPPPQRPKSQCPSLAKDLAALCAPWMQGFTDSIQQGNKAHPFPDTLLSRVRERLSQECQNGKDHMEVAEGQPFFLNLGTQIGNRGEEDPLPDYPPLQGRDNYPSAKEFTDEINATFEEEKKMGMVVGPFTQQEAAEACECTPDQLCPGPMAGIQESDKMGTIFDGSWGGANTHIQENTTERTTAPIVMDCVQALHWLHAIQPGPSTPAGCGEEGLGDGWTPPTKDQAWTLYSKLTSPRLTDESRSLNPTGNTR